MLVIELVARDFSHDHPVYGTVPADPDPVAIDPDAFAISLRNLIENALRHGSPGSPVTVTLDPDGVLHVINACPVVPGDHLARLAERFQRGDSRAPGAGLGLTIAAAIARSAGGTLELLSPALGRDDGFEARFTLAALPSVSSNKDKMHHWT